jgi:hypothetical protein
MTPLAYIGPGKGFDTTYVFQFAIVAIGFSIIAICFWWARPGHKRRAQVRTSWS